MAAVHASGGSNTAPWNPNRAGPAVGDMKRRRALGVAERPLLSPSTVERGSELLHAEDPVESAAILNGSGASGNDNDDNTGNGDGNDMDGGSNVPSERLNAVLNRVEAFISMLQTHCQQPLETVPTPRRRVEAPREEVHDKKARTEESHRGGLWDSKWAPHD